MSYIVVTDNIKRNNDSIKEINPFDKKQLQLLKKYDVSKKTNYIKVLSDNVSTMETQDFELYRMANPVVKTICYIGDNKKIKDACFVEYENDLKIFRAYINLNNINMRDELVNYAFKRLGMEEVTFLLDKNDKKLMELLLGEDYIPLYDEKENDDYILFVKGKDDYTLSQNSIICV